VEETPEETVMEDVPPAEPKPALEEAQPVLAKPKPKPAVPELPKAKPAKKSKPVEQPPAKPKVRVSPSAPGVVQPKREAPTPKVAPKPISPPAKPAPPPESIDQPLPIPSPPEPVDEPMPSLPKPKAPEPALPDQIPLQKRIQARQEASQSIKALKPETFTPHDSSPLVAPHVRSILSKDKYLSKPSTVEEPQEPHQIQLPGPEIESEPFQLQEPVFEPEFDTPSVVEPLQMALAYAPRTLQPAPSISPQPTAPTDKPTSLTWPPTEEELLEEIPQEPELEEAQIQPFEDDETDGEEIVSRQIDEEIEEIEPTEDIDDELDLDQLAEDVLPLVKRILEIESERLSRNLR